MSDVLTIPLVPAAASGAPAVNWPAAGSSAVGPPITQAALFNAAARAAASNARRDMAAYLRLRRKPA